MDRRIPILILEDNPSDAELMKLELRRAGFTFTATWAQDKTDFLQSLDESIPDLILADYSVPGFGGLAALALVKQRIPDVPVVIVSGAIGEETAIESLKAGATDYVLKQRLDRLGPVVDRALREAQEINERRQAEKAILRAKEEWERTFDSVPDLIALLDCEHRIVRVNRAMADRLGVRPAEAVGLHCYEAVHGGDAPPAICPHALTCHDGKEHIAEVHEPNLGGDFMVSTTPMFDSQGQLTGAVHVARDITERKQAEEALAQSERQLRLVMDAGPTLISYVDSDCRYRRVNDIYGQWYGVTPKELEGRYVREVMGDAAWQAVQPYAQRALAGETVTYEQELCLQTAGTRWVHGTYTPDIDETGQVRGYVVHAMDVSERKLAEDRLIKEKTFSESAINSMPGVFYMFKETGPLLRWNRNFEKVTGYSADEVSGMGPLDFFDVAEKEPIAGAIAEVFTEGSVSVEADFRTKTGSKVPYYFTGLLMPTDDGPYLIGAGIDISERKHAEEVLRNQVCLLQRALLPSVLPTIPEHELSSTYIPGRTGEEVGGDFYDVFMTENGKVGILIGDVTGKGIEAAALAAATRSTIRAFAYESSSAGDALTHANSVLINNHMTGGQFVTVFVAVLDPDTGEVRYASAGHPPAAVRHASGDLEFLSLGNMPLGVMESGEYVEGEACLERGGKIVLYTDGITEARHGPSLFGQEGLSGVLERHGHLSPDEVVGRILSAALDWSKGRLTDDTAILVVGRQA